MRSHHTASLTVLAGLSLVGALTACSSPATPSTPAPETDGGSSAGTGDYADGTYTESADYQSPNGSETVEVTLTLENNIITAVEVVGDGDNPDSRRYQGEFADGIGDVVVGKNIDEISVSKVAGSSLTSGGFNDAVEAIKADAS